MSLRTTILLSLLLAGCASPLIVTPPPAPPEITFSGDIQPLIAEKFAPFLTEDEQLQVNTWVNLMAGSEHGAVIIPYDAERSVLLQVARQAAEEGAPGAPTDGEIELVRQWIERGARNDRGEVAYADSEERLYVANEGEAFVSVVDMQENLVIRTVDFTDLGFSANSKPHDVAVEPDGSHWYVSLIGENVVLKFTRDNEIVGRATMEAPGMLTFNAASDRLYVGRSMSAVNPPRSIGAIDTGDMSLELVDVFYPRPHAIDVTPDGATVYSASLAENQVGTVDVEAMETALTPVEGSMHMIIELEVSPDGETMVGGGQMSGQFFFFDVSGGEPVLVDELSLGGQPWHPVYTPDGEYIYVPRKTANAVTVLDAGTHEVEAVIESEGFAEPHGAEVRADGRYVYISNVNTGGGYKPRYGLTENEDVGTITVIDTETREVVKVLEVGRHPKGLGA